MKTGFRPSCPPLSAWSLSALLIGLLLALCAHRLGRAATSEDLVWTPLSDSQIVLSVETHQGRILRRFIHAEVSVANHGAMPVAGALRLVVESSPFIVLGADGLTVAGEPYILLLDRSEDLHPGDSLNREISASRSLSLIHRLLPASYRLEQGAAGANAPPRADAGPHRTVEVGDWITLDASASSDPDSNRLEYAWELIERPAGSLAQLSDPRALRPSFFVDLPGTYAIALVVNDGVSQSEPDEVLISTHNSPPIADAGADQLSSPGDLVLLDGSASSDADRDRLRFRWALTAAPANSRARLFPSFVSSPRLHIDQQGAYAARLFVSERAGRLPRVPAEPATVIISTESLRPSADAGPDRYVLSADWLTLDGSASFDPDGDGLDYRWALLHAPAGSDALLMDARTAAPSLLPDLPGDYVAQLIVNDGERDSAPDTALIVAEAPPVNRPPIIESSPPLDAVAQQEYSYAVTARDPDSADRLGFSLATAPWGMTIEADTGLTRWIPDASRLGEHRVRILVTDSHGLETEQSYSLQVSAPPNRAPQLRSYPPRSVHQGAEYRYQAAARDPDGDPLVYLLREAPAGMGIDAHSGLVRWTSAESGTYAVTIRVTDDAGASDSQTFEVRVLEEAIPPVPETIAPTLEPSTLPGFLERVGFLVQGEHPIQVGLESDILEPHRAAVVRGRVLSTEDAPLAGVRISVQGQPELGFTLSREDGWFDLLVNGGGELVLGYEKDGWLPVQRRVTTPWEDFAVAEEVVLTALDANATDIRLGAQAQDIQVARGGRVTDGDGERTATLLFEPGTSAELVFADGTSRPTEQIRIRATEYTVGERGLRAMPGELPASTGYTYAVELSADEALAAGATHVAFDRPISFYVENFLGYPVGTRVPVGWYDQHKSAWIPERDGLVIAIIGADPQGRALIDLDGSGTVASAEALAALGMSDGERGRLAALYAPGTSLWRSRHHHLSPWDCNFPFVVDSTDPRAPDIPPQVEDEPSECEAIQSGSSIRANARTLGETLPVAGTGYSLTFRSDRTKAYRNKIAIRAAATGDAPPDGLLTVEMQLTIAGQTRRFDFGPQPDQQIRIPWSHLDPYGRPLSGSITGVLQTCYRYGLRRLASRNDLPTSFASISGGFRGSGAGGGGARSRNSLPILRERSALTAKLCSQWNLDISETGAVTDTTLLGGWSLSPVHSLDTRRGLLQRGDGNERVGSRTRLVYQSVANPQSTSGAVLSAPGAAPFGASSRSTPSAPSVSALLVEADGSILLAHDGGLWRHFGGEPTQVSAAAGLTDIQDLARAADGGVFLIAREADAPRRVYRLGKEGTRTPVAGNGQAGCAPNFTHALQAPLQDPAAIAVTSDGSVYIADAACHTVHRLRPDGMLVRTAGTGADAHDGDFDSALLASIGTPTALALGPNEDLYIGSAHGIVRRMEPSGFMTTIAGIGESGYSGDGGPATEARLGAVGALATAQDGTLYIDDTATNARVRKVSPSGVIETVAGNGESIPVHSGAQAATSSMGVLGDLFLGPDGHLFIAEREGALWRIARPLLPLPWQGEILVPDGSLIHRFDRSGRHLGVRDALTGSLLRTLEYDQQGRLASISDFPGRITRIERAEDGFALIAPDGQRTEVTFGQFGQLEHLALPEGSGWSTESTSDGALLGLTDPRGETTSFVYDADGRLVTDSNPLGGGWVIDSRRERDLTETEMRSAEGRAFRYRRERRDGALHIENISPDGTRSRIDIHPDGTTQSQSADGTAASVSYAADPLWGYGARYPAYSLVTTPAGLRRETSIRRESELTDPNDPFTLVRLTSATTVNARTWTNVYDAATRTETTTSPEGRRSSTRVDQWRRPVREDTPALAPRLYRYDEQGRIAEIQQGESEDARLTLLGYDDNGWLQSITDPLGRVLTLHNDALGRVLQVLAPDGAEASFGYDRAGNLTALTPPERPAHTMEHDALGQEVRYDPPPLDEGTGGIDTDYNLDREPTRLSHDSGPVIAYHFDESAKDGRLARRSTPAGDTRLDYDDAGRISALTGPSGERIELAYDGALIVSESFSGTLDAELQTSWSDDFRIIGETLVTDDDLSHSVSYGYDGDGLLTAASDLSLSYDADNGLLTSTVIGRIRTNLTYNPFGELQRLEARLDGEIIYALDYRHDKLGRILEKNETIAGESTLSAYNYDLAGRLQNESRNDTVLHSYAYDANGNRTHVDGVEMATYDEQDRLLSHDLQHKRPTPDTPIAYIIDPRERRIAKSRDGEIERLWVYRDRLNPIAELKHDGTLRSLFIYADQAHVPAYMIRNEAGEEHRYRILSDHLGSVRLVIDADSGDIAQRLDYDVWGRVTGDTNPGFQPFGFAGGLYDPHTGLVRFGARDYDPFTGRWTGKDRIGFGGGSANLYGYSFSDPVNFIDPDGDIKRLLSHRGFASYRKNA